MKTGVRPTGFAREERGGEGALVFRTEAVCGEEGFGGIERVSGVSFWMEGTKEV